MEARVRRWILMLFALVLLAGAMAPVFEAFDNDDTKTTLVTDTEFRLSAFAVLGAMAVASFLIVSQALRVNRSNPLLRVVAIALGTSSLPRGTSFNDTSPPVETQLRI
jgi:hypothetical protein